MRLSEIGNLGSEVRDNPKIGDEVNGWIVHLRLGTSVILRDKEIFTCRETRGRKEWMQFCNEVVSYFKRGDKEETREIIKWE